MEDVCISVVGRDNEMVNKRRTRYRRKISLSLQK